MNAFGRDTRAPCLLFGVCSKTEYSRVRSDRCREFWNRFRGLLQGRRLLYPKERLLWLRWGFDFWSGLWWWFCVVKICLRPIRPFYCFRRPVIFVVFDIGPLALCCASILLNTRRQVNSILLLQFFVGQVLRRRRLGRCARVSQRSLFTRKGVSVVVDNLRRFLFQT